MNLTEGYDLHNIGLTVLVNFEVLPPNNEILRYITCLETFELEDLEIYY